MSSALQSCPYPLFSTALVFVLCVHCKCIYLAKFIIKRKLWAVDCGTLDQEKHDTTNYRGRDRVINLIDQQIKSIIVVVNAVRVKSGTDVDIDFVESDFRKRV